MLFFSRTTESALPPLGPIEFQPVSTQWGQLTQIHPPQRLAVFKVLGNENGAFVAHEVVSYGPQKALRRSKTSRVWLFWMTCASFSEAFVLIWLLSTHCPGGLTEVDDLQGLVGQKSLGDPNDSVFPEHVVGYRL